MAEKPSDVAPSDVAPLRVLLVDDHFDSVYAMSRLLGRRGFTVYYATTGEAALRMLAEQPYDVLVSDINLAEMNGFTLMRQARAEYPAIRGVAVSGHGMDDVLAECRSAGFEEFFVKPVDFAKLQQAIRRVCAAAPTVSQDTRVRSG